MAAASKNYTLQKVLAEMQNLDELGGVENAQEYIAVMEEIAAVALERARTCRLNQES